MNNKIEIAKNWLPRYTGTQVEEFGRYIILTNFRDYVDNFARLMDVEVKGLNSPMQSATKDNITIINFSMGSPIQKQKLFKICCTLHFFDVYMLSTKVTLVKSLDNMTILDAYFFFKGNTSK